MKHFGKRVLGMLLVLAMLTTVLSGCVAPQGDNYDENGNYVADKTISDKTIEYTLYAHNWNAYAGQPNDRVLKYLEDKFNVKLRITGAAEAVYNEKFNALIQSDSTPDMFWALLGTESYYRYIEDDIMLPMDEYLSDEETPYLKAFFETDDYKNIDINGHYYFLPLLTEQSGHCLFVRRDWMNNLGIDDPKTIDEFTAMIKAFTENDPDGNNQNDTYGWACGKTVEWLRDFQGSFGIESEWTKDENGEWGMDVLTDEYQDFLNWLMELVNNGYITKNMYNVDDGTALQDFYAGKAGVVLGTAGGNADTVEWTVKQINPNAEVDVIQIPAGVSEGGFTRFGGFWGGWNISADTEEPYRLIKILDYLLSPEGQELRYYGVEGIHYTKDGDVYKPNLNERNADGLTRWTQNDAKQPVGGYLIGGYFGTMPFTIEDNKIVRHHDYSTYSNPTLVQKSIDLQAEKGVKKNPWNIMDFSFDLLSFRIKAQEKCDTILSRTLAGQNTVAQAHDIYERELNALGYADYKEEYNQVMEGLGL